MVKYDTTFKLIMVEAYLAGEGSYLTIAKKYGVGSKASIVKCVRIYSKYGRKGLDRKKYRKYSVQFKINVIEYKLRTRDSYINVDIPD